MGQISLLIINGKNSGNEALRQAVYQQRAEGNDIQVRVTWESSDRQRFVQEALHIQAQTIIAAGVDGAINNVALSCSFSSLFAPCVRHYPFRDCK